MTSESFDTAPDIAGDQDSVAGLERLQESAEHEVSAMQLDQLEEVGLERTLESYYLIGPYPPLASMGQPLGAVVEEAISTLRQPVDVYVHFPFCRVVGSLECTFCHFYKVKHDESLETRYVDACIRELRMWSDRLGRVRVRSAYFGGGTFSLISPDNLRRLLVAMRSEFDLESAAEIKFEIHADAAKTPDLLSNLLRVLMEFGTTHIVIDIQSLNEESLRQISWGRIRPEDYFETLGMCRDFGFDRYVTGLILGLPHDSFESFLRSVQRIAAIPEVVTLNLFPLMFRRGDVAFDQLQTDPAMFPGVRQRDVLHYGARMFLADLGFDESPIYFMNRGSAAAVQQTSKFEGNSLIGIGASSFGMLIGGMAAQYYNTPSIQSYLDHVERGTLPFWRIGLLSNAGLSARRLILGCLNLNRALNLTEIDPLVRSNAAPLLRLLCDLGLLRKEGALLSITPKGLLRAEEMSFFLAEEEVRRSLRGTAGDDISSRLNYFVARSSEQEDRLWEAVAGLS
jgi:oxygen-independent coproporphyrinogen-3 oxidase